MAEKGLLTTGRCDVMTNAMTGTTNAFSR